MVIPAESDSRVDENVLFAAPTIAPITHTMDTTGNIRKPVYVVDVNAHDCR